MLPLILGILTIIAFLVAAFVVQEDDVQAELARRERLAKQQRR